jgi:hypothetical protein
VKRKKSLNVAALSDMFDNGTHSRCLPKTDTYPKLEIENFGGATFSVMLTKTIISKICSLAEQCAQGTAQLWFEHEGAADREQLLSARKVAAAPLRHLLQRGIPVILL